MSLLLIASVWGLGACDSDPAVCAVDDAGVTLPDAEPPPESNGTQTVTTQEKLPKSFVLDDSLELQVQSGRWTTTTQYDGSYQPAQPRGSQINISGTVSLKAGPYAYSLNGASININSFSYPRAGYRADYLYGYARVTMPALHTFSGINSPLTAQLGFGEGSSSTLKALGMPLAPSRHYFYFTTTAGLSSSFGTGPFSADTSRTTTVIVDPKDPAFFVAGPMGPISAVALSEKSLIPFNAQTQWGFDTPTDEFPSFSGQSYIAGEVSLEEIPITVSGNVTTKFVNWDGQSALDKKLFEHTLGINGSFNLGWDFLDGLFRLEVPLSKASLYMASTVHPYKVNAAVSGTAGTATFMPSWLPVLMSANSNFAGYLDTSDVSRNHIDGMSDITLKASTLGKVIGIDMKDITMQNGTYHVDKMGFRYNGEGVVSVIPFIESTSYRVTACFGGDTKACLSDDQTGTPVMGSKDWLLRLEGDASVFNVPLLNATTMASPQGISVAATFKTQGQRVAITGALTPGPTPASPHVALTGTASFSLPLIGINEILATAVADGSCGYDKITDAAKCGYNLLSQVGDICGAPHCSWSWKHGLRCKAISCQVKVAKTCNGLAKKCPPPNDDLGRIDGSVALTINEQGMSGKMTGRFCPVGNGSCSSLSEVGTLDFSQISNPKICINSNEISSTLPIGKKFCVSF
ncbi:MAG: hypothetical protein SF187_24840 [Deltaproteobacteria bacterium]|nr:hypothetical protein [Deltaproteobacteria bacterium]